MVKKTYNVVGKQAVHAVFFFTFVVVGFAVLSIAKVSALMPPVLVAISAGLMATYAFCIVFVPATKLRLDVAGDNMYYLGFLYTLSSLAVAIGFSKPEQILANFGVAISSTIIGIAARVAFNQMRVDPNDVEQASRVELSEATRRVTGELNETIMQLTKFRTMTMQVMAEGYEDVQKNVESTAQEIFQSLKDTSEKNALVLSDLGKNSSAEQAKLSDSIQNLKASNEELISANRGMVSQIASASEAYQILASRYADAKVLEGRIIDEVKMSLDVIKDNVATAVTKNLEDLEAKFEVRILDNIDKTIEQQNKNLSVSSDKLMGELQKSTADSITVSKNILEIKNLMDAHDSKSGVDSAIKKRRIWFWRK